MSGELAAHERPDAKTPREIERRADTDPDERGDRDIAATLGEERGLELLICVFERLVVPVETAAGLGCQDEETEENGAEERVLLACARTCVRVREDRGRRLALQLLEREPRVLPPSQYRLALVDVRAD